MSNNTQKVRDVLKHVISEGDIAAVDRYFAADFIDHEGWPGQPPTLEGFKAGMTAVRTAFPDLAADVELMLEDADKVCVKFQLTGTHLGTFMGAESTGKTISVGVIDILRLRDGMVVEHWGITDAAALGEQLGLHS